jgi:hypothetical protein
VSRYVFYLEGPQAVVTELPGWRTARTHISGGDVASVVGARIPSDTYWWATSALSQDRRAGHGVNDTALLPLEV